MNVKMEISPCRSVEEVLNWEPDPEIKRTIRSYTTTRSKKYLRGSDWNANKSWEWLLKTPLSDECPDKPRTLVCHDMMGGYTEDRFIQPTNQDGYSFVHWSGLDVFVYFSHHLVTIPPPGWINAAKLHGVAVLGTIITEWEEGKRQLETVLQDENKMQAFVNQCVRMAEEYGFQGWLLNIENPVEESLVPNLLKLVALLRDRTEKTNKDGLVLWYDSVTIQGKLEWQDEVNHLNKPFMEQCHGIFLNYTWKTPETSEPPKDSLENSILAMDKRSQRTNIFVGVDVFGRGCYGGGGFNCDAALQKIREKNLSAAIFAPGWTYEIPHREKTVERDFFRREHLFWSRLEKHLNFHALKIDMNSSAAEDADAVGGLCKVWSEGGGGRLVFRSGFCTGRGQRWFHIASSQPQPSLINVNHQVSGELPTLREPSSCTPGAPEPHSSSPGAPETPSSSSFPPGAPATQYCCHTTDTKAFTNYQSLYVRVPKVGDTAPLFLVELDTNGQELIFVLVLAPVDARDGEGYQNTEDPLKVAVALGTDAGVEIVLEELCETEHLLSFPDKPASGWTTAGFRLASSRTTIHKIGLRTKNSREFYLGQISIYASKGSS